MARRSRRPHCANTSHATKERMLRFARALGFLAPLAVTLCASVVLVLTSSIDAFGRSWMLSAVFLDIDRFKPINDTFGHNSGDAVLRQVAGIIVDNIRPSDLFGRYGGEEFMLILPESLPAEAVEVAERLRSAIAQTPLQIPNGQTVIITISIGVAGGRGHELQVDALVDQADAAMYAAKGLGRNRTYLYRDLDDGAPIRRAPISPERRAAAT